jgi:hypothetical protein
LKIVAASIAARPREYQNSTLPITAAEPAPSPYLVVVGEKDQYEDYCASADVVK